MSLQVDHPTEQAALLKHSGAPAQELKHVGDWRHFCIAIA